VGREGRSSAARAAAAATCRWCAPAGSHRACAETTDAGPCRRAHGIAAQLRIARRTSSVVPDST
jgi:hypothetical protein